MLTKPKLVSAEEERLLAIVGELRREVADIKAENAALRAQLEGDIPKATAWLQTKVWRQRAVLDRRERRLITQKFVLRTLEELGRGLTREEYVKARDADAQKERIDEP